MIRTSTIEFNLRDISRSEMRIPPLFFEPVVFSDEFELVLSGFVNKQTVEYGVLVA